MKHLHIIITVLLCTLTTAVKAQYYSVNFDKKTVAAMAAAYASGAAAESYYNEQVQDILKHYNAAEVATAGIYASKFLERKALTDLGIWSSSTENYYYRRIHHMVADKIMPKIWTVAGMMLKSPQNALYWGSYLLKTCDDVKTLCYQFESVVTNSTLTFSDIQFLTINSEIAQILKLSEIGNVDFKKVLDDLSKVPGNFTVDNLKADIEKLYQQGVSLATAGAGNILQTSEFNNLFQGKLGAAINIVDNYSNLWNSFDKNVGKTIINQLGGKDNVAGLFQLSDYNLTGWMTDYLNETEGQYYTQRWYIYRRDAGSETLAHYTPPTGNDDIINGSHWYRINTGDANYYPSSAEREAILQNSENHAGWSRNRVQQLNNSKDGYTYRFNYWQQAYIISRKNKQTKKAYAYEITVTKSWDRKETVYEDVFDSYTMDLNVFKGQLNARLSELNDNEEGYTYYIGSDSRKYYQATDAAKLKGVETVTISVTCSDGVKLGEGNTSYKCRTCGGSLNQHSKDCAMSTSVTENNLDLTDLNKQLSEATSKITSLSSSITALERENASLLKRIATASVNEAASLRQQYNRNLNTISSMKKELTDWQNKEKQYKEALEEAGKDNEIATDDYYRIPAIMADLKSAFNLTWQGTGSWSGYSYIRKATMPNIDGVITFKATISISRKPKYFLGIKIHRAILQISWDLTSEYSNTQVVEVMNLDPNKSEKEKADEVNKRISEIARDYPDCQITTEYAKSAPTEENDGDDVYHLLWSSDRLEIAREVDSRITKIYSDLVILEKFMHYKHNIVDMLLKYSPWQIDDEQGRRRTLLDDAYQRWRENGRLSKKRNPWEYGEKFDKDAYRHEFNPDYAKQYEGTVDIRHRERGGIHQ